MKSLRLLPLRLSLPLCACLAACSATKDTSGPTNLDSSVGNPDSSLKIDGGDFDVSGFDASDPETPPVVGDPKTCTEAAAAKTYVGCDFWPTVTDNIVRPDFDYAVAVANTGDVDADITVTKAGATVATDRVPAGGLTTLYLPWVPELKAISPDNGCGTDAKLATVRAKNGAYHLTTSRPVTVYQFSAIEYAGKGGPKGKDWTAVCAKNCLGLLGCFSYTNDASLLLPTAALTGNYRVAGVPSWTFDSGGSSFTFPPYFAVTGTKNGTSVTVKLSSAGSITAGGGITATSGGGTTTFALDEGEVVMIIGTASADLSGSLIKASAPVQVITGISCTQMPHGVEACDHLEESLLPVETLGKHYFATVPTAPTGTAAKAVVMLYGNVDGTVLTYPGTKPAGAPGKIDAGQVVDLGVVTSDFEIVGDHELTVATFMHGAGPVTGAAKGDPSQSFATTVEQYRKKYVFLAPIDYDANYVDIVQPMDAVLTLDGAAVTAKPTLISSGFGVTRVRLGIGKGGAHVLEGDKPFGIQVLGYGSYTSYQYPGGLNLGVISPVPIK